MSTAADDENPALARAVLFSGHMIDAPGRAAPRFPAAREPAVARAIRDKLAEMNAGGRDAAISSGACGGDILFAEAALERGVSLRVYLPFEQPVFVEKSVRFAGSDWVERYRAVVERAEVFIAPRELGPLDEGVDPYERTNLWMLEEAQRLAKELVFLSVWDGEAGDGPGGTKHMMSAARQTGGAVHWIDIRNL